MLESFIFEVFDENCKKSTPKIIVTARYITQFWNTNKKNTSASMSVYSEKIHQFRFTLRWIDFRCNIFDILTSHQLNLQEIKRLYRAKKRSFQLRKKNKIRKKTVDLRVCFRWIFHSRHQKHIYSAWFTNIACYFVKLKHKNFSQRFSHDFSPNR